jgi:hypothetical protein
MGRLDGDSTRRRRWKCDEGGARVKSEVRRGGIVGHGGEGIGAGMNF